MTSAMAGLSAKPIIVTTAGGILIWSGFKGMTITATLRDLLTGRNPSKDSPSSGPNPLFGNNFGTHGFNSNPSGNLNPNVGSGGAQSAHLSVGQIYRYARGAGFSATAAVIATAVAMAESGGRPAAHCLNCVPGVREDSRGLWQINVDAHPQFANANLYDPATNAAAAFAVSSSGRNFSPWSTYQNGAYQQFMNSALGAATHG